jgi:hypothetical protein
MWGGDLGRPVVVQDPDSEAGQAFARLAERVRGALEQELVPA